MIQIGKNICVILIVLLFFLSCVGQGEIAGIYVIDNFSKNIDTIKVSPNGTYERSIYDKSNGKIIFKNKSLWEYSDSEITFKNFLVNEGELIYNQKIRDYNIYLMSYYSFPLKRRFLNSQITIIINSDLNYRYSKKIVYGTE